MSEEFSFSTWLADGAKGVRNALPHWGGGGLVPEEFREHLQTSRKELLLAFRSLFDVAIQKMEAPKSSTRHKTTKIKVE